MAKNTILMIGDGMGWEMARAAAIQKQINAGKTGDTLADFYTQGEGTGLNFQRLAGYGLSTTYGTTIADAKGVFSTAQSALDGTISQTGSSPVLPGFKFDPTFNPGTTATGGGKIADGAKGRVTTQRAHSAGDGSLTTSVQRDGAFYSEETVTRRDGSGSSVLLYPRGQGGAGQPDVVPIYSRFAPGQANPTYTTWQNGQPVRHEIPSVREISYSEGSVPGLSNLAITTHDGRSFTVSDVGAGSTAASVTQGTGPWGRKK